MKRIDEATIENRMNFDLMSYTSTNAPHRRKNSKNPLTNVVSYIILPFQSRRMYSISQKRGIYGNRNQSWIQDLRRSV